MFVPLALCKDVYLVCHTGGGENNLSIFLISNSLGWMEVNCNFLALSGGWFARLVKAFWSLNADLDPLELRLTLILLLVVNVEAMSNL